MFVCLSLLSLLNIEIAVCFLFAIFLCFEVKVKGRGQVQIQVQFPKSNAWPTAINIRGLACQVQKRTIKLKCGAKIDYYQSKELCVCNQGGYHGYADTHGG